MPTDVVIGGSTDTGSGNTGGTGGSNTGNLVDLSDLILLPLDKSIPKAGDILVYDGTYYVPQDMLISLAKDVSLEEIEDRDILSWNSDINKWVTTNVDNLISGVQFNTKRQAEDEDILVYDSNEKLWVPVSRDFILNKLKLSGIEDVLLSSDVEDQQVLSYDSDSKSWINKSLTLSSLFDVSVDISKVTASKSYLVYDRSNSRYILEDLNLSGLEDIDYNSLNHNSILVYNKNLGRFEEKSPEEYAEIIDEYITLDKILDLDFKTLSNKEVIVYNHDGKGWKTRKLNFSDLENFNVNNDKVEDKDIISWDESSGSWNPVPLTPERVFNYNSADLADYKSLIYNSELSKWEVKYITLEDLLKVDDKDLNLNDIVYWNGTEFKTKRISLSDFVSTSKVDSESFISYDPENKGWKLESVEDIFGRSKLSDLSDVDLDGVISNGDVLYFDNSDTVWKFKSLSLEDLVDFKTVDGDILIKTSSGWTNKSFTLDNLLNLTRNKSNGDVIYYDSSSDSWKVRENSLDNILSPNDDSKEELIIWDITNKTWISKDIEEYLKSPEGLISLNDVELSSSTLSSESILSYDSNSGKWTNVEVDIDFLRSINIDSFDFSYKAILQYNPNSSSWIPVDINDLLKSSLSNLSTENLKDLKIQNPEVNNILSYENGSWVNKFLIPENFGISQSDGNYSNSYLKWDDVKNTWIFEELDISYILNIDTEDLDDKSVIIWNKESKAWEVKDIMFYSDHISKGLRLTDLENVDAPDKNHNNVLAWDSALYKWIPKKLEEILKDLGLDSSGSNNLEGRDWVKLFEDNLK